MTPQEITALVERCLPEQSLTPRSVAEVLALPSFHAAMKTAATHRGRCFAAQEAELQEALVFRRAQQLIGILRVNPLWQERLDASGVKGLPRNAEEWQQLPITDRDTLNQFYMGRRAGQVVPLSHGGFQVIASGGTSGGLPIETVYSMRELRATYRLAGTFFDDFILPQYLTHAGPRWMVTTLSDYEMWSSGSMLGGVLQNITLTNFIHAGPMSERIFHHLLALDGQKAILGMSREIEGLIELGRAADAASRDSFRLAFYGSGVVQPRKVQELEALYPRLDILSYFASNQAEAIGIQLRPDGYLTAVPGLHLIEIVDEQGRWVEEGEEGELVITRLHAGEAPVLRVQLGDRMIRRPALQQDGLHAQQMEFAGRSSDIIHLGESHYAAPRTYARLCEVVTRQHGVDLAAVAQQVQFVNNRPEKSLTLLIGVEDPAAPAYRPLQQGIREVFIEALKASLSLYDQTEQQFAALAQTPYRFSLELVGQSSDRIHRTAVGKTPLIKDTL
jgi:phenylacetate-CoA ligase